MQRISVGSWAALVLAGASLASAQELVGHGGGSRDASGPCITEVEQATARQAIEQYRAKGASFGSTVAGAPVTPPKFPFYPMGGRLYRDLFTNNFNDLDPTGGILDWDCTDFTYDGHDATDVDLRTFTEQTIGVPIFAALDGEVVQSHDGEDDMHTACSGIANYVIIDHGSERFCYYWHMRKNSVAVTPGQIVKAGEVLGMTASSGCSTGPHLHFATYDFGAMTEPYTGTCNPGESQWVDQTPVFRTTYLRDLNVTNVNLGGWAGPPTDRPRKGTFVQGNNTVYFWINLMNLGASSDWRVRYLRPDASVALDSSTQSFQNPFYRWSWWWWGYTLNLDVTGTWHILLDINGATLATAPVEVVASAGQVVNRAPNAVTVSMDPVSPTEDDTIFCLVDTDLVLDDPDYDVVRYRYFWEINGQPFRDVVTAGHSDAIPHHSGPAGSQIRCTVTPSDGIADGPSATATVGLPCPDPCPPFAPFGDLTGTNRNRTLAVTVPGPVTVTAGPGVMSALQLRLVELQNPQPPNLGCCPPPNYSGYEAGAGCTDPDGCVRWVGSPQTFLESGELPDRGAYRAARLQCTPYYHDWASEGMVQVVGAEVVPSSTFELRNFHADCAGSEASCTLVSSPATLFTARFGDVVAPFNPPSSSAQPDGLDIANVVAKFRSAVGAIAKGQAQLQPNAIDPNADVSGVDISVAVDSFRFKAYPYSGPCPCPSTVPCDDTSCSSATVCIDTYGPGSTCVQTCSGGVNDGLACTSNKHCNLCAGGTFDALPCDPAGVNPCPGGACSSDGTCAAGFCRDACGRCDP